jgi:L-lactate dehydrogenase complex protein LldG
MSARDDVLAAIRTAYGPGPRPEVEVPRGYRQHGTPVDVDLFVERVEDYRATVARCADGDLTQAVAEALGGVARVVVPDGLELEVPGAIPDSGLSATDLDGVDAVVTAATVAIAATGTIVLTHGPGQGRRALTLVPDVHVCIVRADQVVADVPDAIDHLDPTRPQTWISGPSATSDIELNRVEGVHGPRTLRVILVDNRVAAAGARTGQA